MCIADEKLKAAKWSFSNIVSLIVWRVSIFVRRVFFAEDTCDFDFKVVVGSGWVDAQQSSVVDSGNDAHGYRVSFHFRLSFRRKSVRDESLSGAKLVGHGLCETNADSDN